MQDPLVEIFQGKFVYGQSSHVQIVIFTMPKKGGKPGASQGKKPAPAAPPDDSFIIFSNSDKEPKPRKNGSATGSPAVDGPALAGEVPRVDVKTLIGGASWTGKLPVNILSEHCRKQRWEQPEYTRVCNLRCCRIYSAC